MTRPKVRRKGTHAAPPAWAAPYQQRRAFSWGEARNLLCGLPPVSPVDAPARTRELIASDFTRDEPSRVVADHHMREAILVGDLQLLPPADELVLAKLTGGITANELEGFRRAVVHEAACA